MRKNSEHSRCIAVVVLLAGSLILAGCEKVEGPGASRPPQGKQVSATPSPESALTVEDIQTRLAQTDRMIAWFQLREQAKAQGIMNAELEKAFGEKETELLKARPVKGSKLDDPVKVVGFSWEAVEGKGSKTPMYEMKFLIRNENWTIPKDKILGCWIQCFFMDEFKKEYEENRKIAPDMLKEEVELERFRKNFNIRDYEFVNPGEYVLLSAKERLPAIPYSIHIGILDYDPASRESSTVLHKVEMGVYADF